MNKNLIFKDFKRDIRNILNLKHSSQYISLKRNKKVIKTKIQNKDVYIKYYSPIYSTKIGDKLRNLNIKKSTALNEFEILLLLEKNQIPVVQPFLVIENKLSNIFLESILLTLEFPGLEANKIIESAQYSFQYKKAIMEKGLAFLFKIHKINIADGDYRFRNILIQTINNNEFKLVLIDKEMAKKNYSNKYGNKYRKIKDCAKYIANYINGLVKSSNYNGEKKETILNELSYYKEVIINSYQLTNMETKYLDRKINKKLKDLKDL